MKITSRLQGAAKILAKQNNGNGNEKTGEELNNKNLWFSQRCS
jgi:hypothetical protein